MFIHILWALLNGHLTDNEYLELVEVAKCLEDTEAGDDEDDNG